MIGEASMMLFQIYWKLCGNFPLCMYHILYNDVYVGSMYV